VLSVGALYQASGQRGDIEGARKLSRLNTASACVCTKLHTESARRELLLGG